MLITSKFARMIWLIKSRLSLVLQITGNTRVCSRHFIPSDYKPPDIKGRMHLKDEVKPTIFHWSRERKERRPLNRASVW